MRVLAFMKYGSKAASTRQRLLQFVPYLAEHGIEVDYIPLLGNNHLARIAHGRGAGLVSTVQSYLNRIFQLIKRRDYDILWVHCELFPYLPGVLELLARSSGRPIVYDYDDAIFHMYDAHPRQFVRRFLGSKLAPLLRSASACVCGNAYLQAYADQYCRRTIVIPTVVDTDVYEPSIGRAEPAGQLTVGWIGSPSTWVYVEPLVPVLEEVLPRFDARFLSVGAGPRATSGSGGVHARPWQEDQEVRDIQDMDIGIMPLPDEPWARGKCGYKLVQYMACGLPAIASPVGVNRHLISHGRSGFLASSNDEWRHGLIALLKDRKLRERMGAEGRAEAVRNYSLTAQAPRLLSLLREVGARRNDRHEAS